MDTLYSVDSGARALTSRGDWAVAANAAAQDELPAIIFIDPRAITRNMLGSWLSKSLRDFTIQVATSADEALTMVGASKDVALFLCHIGSHSVATPEVQATLAALGRDFPAVPVAVLADAEDLNSVIAALRAGVRGYIATNLSAPAAIEAVKLVCAGEVYAPTSSFMNAMSATPTAQEEPLAQSKLAGFSPRQAQIIQCLSRGIANKCIAYELSMSQGTVKVHIRNIMKKLGARNRTQVVVMTTHLLTGRTS